MPDVATLVPPVVTAPAPAPKRTVRYTLALAPIATDMLLVDSNDSRTARVGRGAHQYNRRYIGLAGGKRLRPAVLILIARALGYLRRNEMSIWRDH